MMKKRGRYSVLFLLVFTVSALVVKGQSLRPDKLACEYIENPLGIGTPKPALSWQLVSAKRNQKQSAYEIVVGDNLAAIKNLEANVWSSGTVKSSQSINIEYGGAPLQSFKRYFWRVRVYDQDGSPSTWSNASWFETALLQPSDWQAKWISDGQNPPQQDEDFYKDHPSPLFRKTFEAKKRITAARLYISGLGYYEAYLNGAKIGDHVLDPGWTSYSKEVLYSVYDVTDNIKRGANAIGVMLGNGWYNALPLRMWGSLDIRNALYTGQPCVKAQLQITYADGKTDVIATDKSWQTAPGPVVCNSVYLGEHYDARLEQSDWAMPGGKLGNAKNAMVVQGPPGQLNAQLQPAIKVTKEITPVNITEPKDSVYLFDMGQNFAGVAQIRVQAPPGTRITLRYGEEKYKDGNLDVMTAVAGQIKAGNGGPGAPAIAWQEDNYITKGQGVEVWSPGFTFHSFRYVEVTGWPGVPTINDVKGLRMNADVENAGTFTCSNSMFNKLDELLDWTFKSNLFSVQSDCPAREKFGYAGDLFCTAESFIYHFDMANFYRKVLQDYANDQRPAGGFTETAPFVGIADDGLGDSTGPISFQLVVPYVAKQLYDFYGDKRVIEKYYPALQKFARFLQDSAQANLYFKDLSDHESLTPKPVALTASAAYYNHIKLLATFAGILGKKEEQATYDSLAGEIQQSIIARFIDTATGKVDSGTQTAQAFALWNGLARAAQKDTIFNRLLNVIDSSKGHLTTGIFGTKMLLDVLREFNRNDVAYTMVNKRSFPGWGYMIDNGATTLWETWAYSDNVYSQNHPMFGSVGEWFYRSLLGINAGAPGFEKVIIKPQPAGNLTYAKGAYQSVRGPIVSDWQKNNSRFILHVEIPANTTAEIWVPMVFKGSITEDGKDLSKVAEVKLLRTENDYTVIETGSGKYDFEVSNK